MNIWLIWLKTAFSEDEELLKNKKTRNSCEFGIINNILFIGWYEGKPADDARYRYLQGAIEGQDDKEKKALRSIKYAAERIIFNEHQAINIKENDLCLMCNGNQFYIAKVKDNVTRYHPNENYIDAGVYDVSFYRHVEKWYLIGGLDDTPAIIVHQLRARNQKTIDIRYNDDLKDICKLVYNELCDNKDSIPACLQSTTGQKPLNETNFIKLLHGDDLEDIVGLYLQSLGYLIQPSSCKHNTHEIEYILLHLQEKRKAVVQVKKAGPAIDILEYNKYQNYEVYLLSENDNYLNMDQLSNHMHIIDKKSLFTFFIRIYSENGIFKKRMIYLDKLYAIPAD